MNSSAHREQIAQLMSQVETIEASLKTSGRGRSGDGSAIAQNGISTIVGNFNNNCEAAKKANENTLRDNYEKPGHSVPANKGNHEENHSESTIVCLSANGAPIVGLVE
jgi:hypothetical protein